MKEIEIFNIFISSDEVNINELAGKFYVTERSIRYNIEKINQVLELLNFNTIQKTKKGYLTLSKNQNLNRMLDFLKELEILSPYERMEILKLTLALDPNGLNINRLYKKLEVSRTTLKKDFDEVKRELSESELLVEQVKKRGLQISGEYEDIEKFRIKFLMKYLQLYLDNRPGKSFEKIILSMMKDIFKLNNPKLVRKFIKDVAKNLEIIISDEPFGIIASYMLIAILSNKSGKDNSQEPVMLEERFLKETDEYIAIMNHIGEIETAEGIKFRNTQILKLADLVLGSNSFHIENDFYENWIEIDLLAKKLINNVNKRIEVDISNDEILFRCLIHHLKPTIYRIKKGVRIVNPIFENMKIKKDDFYYYVKEATEELRNMLGQEIPEDELFLLIIHFRASIERNRPKHVKKVLLVCSLGYGTATLLAQNIRDTYEVEIMEILPYYALRESIKEYKGIDLIITTVDIKESKKPKDVPVIKINPIFTLEDIKILNEANLEQSNKTILLSEIIDGIEKETKILNREKLIDSLSTKLENKIINDIGKKKVEILEILKEENIYLNQEVKNWQEAIIFGGKVLESKGYISSSYIDDMLEMSNKYSEYIVISEGVAIPHSKNKRNVFKTGMMLLTLKNPVTFPAGQSVDTFFIFSIYKKQEHLNAISELIDLILKYDIRSYLKKESRKRNVIKFISNVES
ncbi:BglG family transcription antiterminator [Sebaldella sp. S0638]|uniref:BglG family transcription antiterminator n=1 Tax=Sebaldella sp. S0638 TaxID=2957809 RepID=UPI00209FC7C4|nr:PTS sugar transporter subunit IIA [Sebaldella sp. S0638]MCP1222976.1 PTS sugar transporter subunit IIA [Sebaldella sp. S0638]